MGSGSGSRLGNRGGAVGEELLTRLLAPVRKCDNPELLAGLCMCTSCIHQGGGCTCVQAVYIREVCVQAVYIGEVDVHVYTMCTSGKLVYMCRECVHQGGWCTYICTNSVHTIVDVLDMIDRNFVLQMLWVCESS